MNAETEKLARMVYDLAILMHDVRKSALSGQVRDWHERVKAIAEEASDMIEERLRD